MDLSLLFSYLDLQKSGSVLTQQWKDFLILLTFCKKSFLYCLSLLSQHSTSNQSCWMDVIGFWMFYKQKINSLFLSFSAVDKFERLLFFYG